MSSAAATTAGDPPVPAKGKKKLIIILALVLLLVLAGAGATLLILKKRAAAAAEEAGDDGAAVAHGQADASAHHLPPIFVPLEPFVVNLADKDSDRYAQIGLTLEVDDPKFAEEMKLYMPAIRNAILMILAHKQSSELLERAGKEALAAEIMRESVRPMGIEIAASPAPGSATASGTEAGRPLKAEVHNPVRRVNFSSFIIQ
jgi:flagellar protein FliL